MTLLLNFCTHRDALYAVRHWHYSRSLPTPPVVRYGIFEDGAFIGCVLFSRGNNGNMARPYGLRQHECFELSRVALTHHDAPVTRIVALALRLLKRHYPETRLVLSYADPAQFHLGKIYQAGNWVYVGRTSSDSRYIDAAGREWHSRQVSKNGTKRQYGELRQTPKASECQRILIPGKYRYAYPLDGSMAQRLAFMRRPYPQVLPPEVQTRATSKASVALVAQAREHGATPMVALPLWSCDELARARSA